MIEDHVNIAGGQKPANGPTARARSQTQGYPIFPGIPARVPQPGAKQPQAQVPETKIIGVKVTDRKILSCAKLVGWGLQRLHPCAATVQQPPFASKRHWSEVVWGACNLQSDKRV